MLMLQILCQSLNYIIIFSNEADQFEHVRKGGIKAGLAADEMQDVNGSRQPESCARLDLDKNIFKWS